MPRGRWAEDGALPAHYPNLRETDSPDPAVRTEWNVRDSDATVVLSHGPLRSGSALTADFARRIGKPLLHLDLARTPLESAAAQLTAWTRTHRVAVLNVAGPRASGDAKIYAAILLAALRAPAAR